METVNSTPNVTIVGTADADSIRNIASNVTINADGGNDIISIYGGVNGNVVEAGDGSDYIYNAVSGSATINGGDGDDYIYVYGIGSSDSRVNAGAGNDSIYNESARTTIGGGEGADTIRNYGTYITLDGGKNNDTMILRRYDSSENRDEGLEIISYTTGDGDDTVYNYTSYDTLSITGSSISTTNSDDNRDVIVKVDSGSITLKDYAGAITFVTLPSSDSDADADADADTDDTTPAGGDDTTSTVDEDTTSSTDSDDTTSSMGDDDTTSSTGDDDTTSSTGGDTQTETKKVDIVYIVDTSGSMNYYINKIRDTATFFTDYLTEQNVEFNLGLVEYDRTDSIKKYDFTSNVDSFIGNVEHVLNNSFGDREGAEYGLTAITDPDNGALSLNFNSDTDKYFVVITDEGYWEDNSYSDTVIASLQAANIQVDVLGMLRSKASINEQSDCQPEWEPIATITGGEFYDIDGDYYPKLKEIVLNTTDGKAVIVNLNLVNGSDTGYFVLDEDSSMIANFITETVKGDTIVGFVNNDHVYEAVSDSDSNRQKIIIPDKWNVTATNKKDELRITGSNATVKGADGNDYISVDSNVSTVTLADLNLSEDDLTLLKHITPSELDHSVENNQLVFSTDGFSFTMSDQSALTSNIKNYNVHNGGDENTIADLLYGTNTHRVSLAFRDYGINPTKTYISNLADKEDTSNGFFELTDGEGSRSLWGGNDGDDTLVGSDGYDEFFYCKGNGNDVIEGAADNDLINLLNVSLDDIDLESFANAIGTDSTTIKFYDGGSIKVNGTSQVGFKVANVDCTFCVKDRQWSVK